jgi:hypothetical protein
LQLITYVSNTVLNPRQNQHNFISILNQRHVQPIEFINLCVTNFAAPPSSPKVSVVDITSRSVTLQWLPPSSTGGTELTGNANRPQNYVAQVDQECVFRLHYRKENFHEQVLGEGDHFGAFRDSALHIQPEGEVTILLQGVC